MMRNWLEHHYSNCLNIIDATNGQEALDRYQENINLQTPIDIILMDISMPVMDGFQCLEKMAILYGVTDRPPTIAITVSGSYIVFVETLP